MESLDSYPDAFSSANRCPLRLKTLLVIGRIGILPNLKSGNGAIVHLVRTVGETQRANARVVLGKAGFVGDARAAKSLDRLVDDLQRHVGRCDLDHGDLGLRGLVADL